MKPYRETTFLHFGQDHGDIILALPFIRSLGGGILYLNESPPKRNYSNLKKLLDASGIVTVEKLPQYGTKERAVLRIDCDLNAFRNVADQNLNLILSYYKGLNGKIDYNWNKPFLSVPVKLASKKPYVIVNLTERYGNPKVNWKKVHSQIVKQYADNIFFIGTESEYLSYTSNIGHAKWLQCEDFYEIAQYIYGADALYCNQSACLTIAAGLGKTYYLQTAKDHRNCLSLSDYENLL